MPRDHCGLSRVSLARMFWHFPRIISYWQNICESLSDATGKPIDPNPLMAFFGAKGSDLVLTSSQHNMVFITLLAHRLILNWKQAQTPTHSALMKDIMQHLDLEKNQVLTERVWG